MTYTELWLKIYSDCIKKLSPDVSADVATKHIKNLPEEVKKELEKEASCQK